MSFNTSPGRIEYTASAGQTVFPFAFKIYANTDIKVYQTLAGLDPNDITDILILTTDYTVTINGDLGGEIILTSGAAINDAITIVRDLTVSRPIEYQTNGDLLATTLNQDQDYQTYLILDQAEINLLNITLQESTQNVSGILPAPDATKVIGWNSTATGLQNYTVGAIDVFINILNVDSVSDLLLVNTTIYSTVNVRGSITSGDGGHGIFNYDATLSAVNDFGTIINGWVRQYSGAVERLWFDTQAHFDAFQLNTGHNTIPETLSNTVDDTKGIEDKANFAGRTAGGFAPTGWIHHSYADGHMHQYDYVGTGGIINVWKNGNNPIRRADKPVDFVGDGVFLTLLEHNLAGPSSHNLFSIDRDAHFVWTGDNPRTAETSATFTNSKADDGLWGFSFLLTNPHLFSFNFAGIQTLATEATNTRTVINHPLSAGSRVNSVGNQQHSISSVVMYSLLTTGNLAMQGGGALEYTSSSTGTVTQLTSKSTGVTLSTVGGTITMNNASLGAGASVSFILTNTKILNTDVLNLNVANFAGYSLETEYVANGAASIRLTNTTAGALADAVLINFALIKIS